MKKPIQHDSKSLSVTADILSSMKINTVGDARNFFVGVNNFASDLSSHSGAILIGTVSSPTKHYVGMQGTGPVVSAGITGYGAKTPLYIDNIGITHPNVNIIHTGPLGSYTTQELTGGITSVLAYGKIAEQYDFSGSIQAHTAMTTRGTILDNITSTYGGASTVSIPHIPINAGYIDLNTNITSPFVFRPKKVNTNAILKQFPEIKTDFNADEKKAQKDYDELNDLLEEATRNSKLAEQKVVELTSTVEKLQEKIRVIEIALTAKNSEISSLKESIVIGNLIYRDNAIYYKESRLKKLTPQAVRLCRLFMSIPDEFITDDTIKDQVSVKDYMTTINMQKLISDIRSEFRSHGVKVNIERITGHGYRFITDKIR